jgi:hypothetical protein
MLLGAANRDAARFAEPESFDRPAGHGVDMTVRRGAAGRARSDRPIIGSVDWTPLTVVHPEGRP